LTAAIVRSVLCDPDNSREQSRLAYRAHSHLVDLLVKRRIKEAERFWATHMATAGEKLLAHLGSLSIIELLD
jgi:DNA-binding GntR family transcriptional regulator